MSYPSKILLFGEHTVLYNSQALSIPFETFSGDWQFLDQVDDQLSDLALELDNSLINITAFKRDCENGLSFQSSIPQQSGLGSSGALTAAIYRSYAYEIKTDITLIQKDLAKIESIFHGQSSGTDALVSFMNSAIHSKENSSFVLDKNPIESSPVHIYLYNSSVKRSAKTYIKHFKELVESRIFEVSHLCNLVDESISELLANNTVNLIASFAALSHFQYDHLFDFIPDSVRPIWQKGLLESSYYFKLCGAGGGGYFLVFSKKDIIDIFPNKLIYLNRIQ